MSRFYIKQILAIGNKAEPSSIELKDGVNLIYGPSNCGKSYIINCINFIFAGENTPFSKANTGYNTVSITMVTNDGLYVQLNRKIVDGKNGEIGDSKVKVSSNVEWIGNKEYQISGNEYSDMILRMFGIKNCPYIISNDSFVPKPLTIRTILHFFFIDETDIFNSSSPLSSSERGISTNSLTSLLYLTTGKDLNDLIPEESAAEKKRKSLQKSGAAVYLQEKIIELNSRYEKAVQNVGSANAVDLNAEIDSIIEEVKQIEQKINDATEKSKIIFEEIYEINARLEEEKFLSERYQKLRSQYEADIKRLEFIINGERAIVGHYRVRTCPFCEHEISDSTRQTSYIEASDLELSRINAQLNDLKEVEEVVNADIAQLKSQLNALNLQNNELTRIVDTEYRPRALQLKNAIKAHDAAEALRQDVYAINFMRADVQTDFEEKSIVDDTDDVKFNAREYFDKKVWDALSDSFNKCVKACGYPNSPNSFISKDTGDAVVGGKFKKDEGKGYRAYLNTIMLFNLMKYLENCEYAPRLLILDSPILSLKEAETPNNRNAIESMRASLFKHIIKHCGENQVIIAENDIPLIDYSNVNLIEFTHEENNGRYGFLKTLK